MGTLDDQLRGPGTQAPPDANEYLLRNLAAGIAHELNQPLAAIAAYADGAALLLRRDPGHAAQALEIIQAIADQALRAGSVIEQLRGATRAMPPSALPLDPNALIRTVQPLLQSLATAQAVRLRIELRTPAPAVRGDADRLQALLVLLFGSALDTVSRLPAARRQVTLSTEGGSCTVELAANEPQGMLFQLHLPTWSAAPPVAVEE